MASKTPQATDALLAVICELLSPPCMIAVADQTEFLLDQASRPLPVHALNVLLPDNADASENLP